MHIPKDNITDWEKCTCNMYNLQKWRIQNIQSPKISVKRQKKNPTERWTKDKTGKKIEMINIRKHLLPHWCSIQFKLKPHTIFNMQR